MERVASEHIATPEPLVSVCMITYNHEAHIARSLEGVVMQQTSFPFEIVIGEDCSTDGTRAICRAYQEQHPNQIRLLLPQHNLGMIANFNTTLGAAKGKYIAFCEGDDYWIDPQKLQKQVDYLDAHPECGCLYTDFNVLYDTTGEERQSVFRTRPQRYPHCRGLADFICHPKYLAPCTWLFRREFAQEPVMETVDATYVFLARILARSEVHFLPDTTAVYRRLEESASHSSIKERRFTRVSKLYATQQKLCALYAIPKADRERVAIDYHSRHLKLFVLLNKEEEIAQAHRYLAFRRMKLNRRFWLIVSRSSALRSIVCNL